MCAVKHEWTQPGFGLQVLTKLCFKHVWRSSRLLWLILIAAVPCWIIISCGFSDGAWLHHLNAFVNESGCPELWASCELHICFSYLLPCTVAEQEAWKVRLGSTATPLRWLPLLGAPGRTSNLPPLFNDRAQLPYTDSFIYLGMVCDRLINLNTAADAALRPFTAGTFRIRQFIREHDLTNRLHIYMWLLKMYAILAGMYASQV